MPIEVKYLLNLLCDYCDSSGRGKLFIMNIKLCLLLIFSFTAHRAYGIQYGVGVAAGLMQQPTSNYFHGIYGLDIGLASNNRSIIGKVGYLERPTFDNAGYEDKESHGFFWLGSGHQISSSQKVLVGLGYGSVMGSLTDDEGNTREFSSEGPLAYIEWNLWYGNFEVGLAHSIMTGIGDSFQTEAYVTWPYSFVLLRMGARI